MDSKKKQELTNDQYSFDSDVSLLIHKSGTSAKKMLLAIWRGFSFLINGILALLLFIFRNGLWVLLGAAIGLGYGIYQLSTRGPEYSSEMTIRTNFNSARSLYSSLDYINSLIAAGDTKSLTSLFGINSSEAKQLSYFSAEAVETDIIASELYDEQFMHYDRTSRVRMDTFWTRTISYKDFKKSLTKFDYPYHTITVKSTNPAIFSKLQDGIVAYISSNDLLQQIKKRQSVSNNDQEQLLVSAIKNLDSLRMAYNQRLVKGQSSAMPSSNQVTIMENNQQSRTPELDLYDKMLELQDELKNTRRKSALEQDIIEIYAPFNPVGRKTSIYNSLFEVALIGLLAVASVLIFIFLYRKLVEFETARKAKRAEYIFPVGS